MLRLAPCDLDEANEFVARHHRHHPPVVGHKFSLAALNAERVVGVVIVGRQVICPSGPGDAKRTEERE